MIAADNILKTAALVRAFFYLWITVEATFLAYLYYNAYKKYKQTPIIKAVQHLLFSVGINFFYMVLIAIVSAVDRKDPLYDWMIVGIPFFAIPLVMSIREFRWRSTESVEDGKDKIKKLERHYKLSK